MNKTSSSSTGASSKPDVEGEGSYTGTRRYNERLKRHIEEEDTEALGEEARRALEGREGEELRQAEERAKRGPAPKKS